MPTALNQTVTAHCVKCNRTADKVTEDWSKEHFPEVVFTVECHGEKTEIREHRMDIAGAEQIALSAFGDDDGLAAAFAGPWKK